MLSWPPHLKTRIYLGPERMTEEEKELYQRIANAGSAEAAAVTRADRNRVFHRPEPEEEDRLCASKVGLTMPELRAKAITSPDTLTELECNIIMRGADYDNPVHMRNPAWISNLPPEEGELAKRVWGLLDDTQENNAYDAALHRDGAAFKPQRDATMQEKIKQNRERRSQQREQMEREATPKWVNEIKDARLPRCGFVVFRTAYGEGTDAAWRNFVDMYTLTGRAQLSKCWKKSNSLAQKHQPLWVADDASLDGADLATLRRRFRAMREQGEIPDRLASDCFLVVDEAILSHKFVTSRIFYKPKTPGSPDPWETALFISAVDPDHDDSITAQNEQNVAGFTGEISIPLPKVFDWLYYCFFAKSEDWNTRYKITQSGPAELTVRTLYSPRRRSNHWHHSFLLHGSGRLTFAPSSQGIQAPYPSYRSGIEP